MPDAWLTRRCGRTVAGPPQCVRRCTGIRDAQIVLDMTHPGPRRVEVRRKLRAASGGAVEVLEARDSSAWQPCAAGAAFVTKTGTTLWLRLSIGARPKMRPIRLLSEPRRLADSAHTT